MKITIEPPDVQRGASFICDESNLVLVVSDGAGISLMSVSKAVIMHRSADREKLADFLNNINAAPGWLHAAREVERKRIADLADS